MKVSVSSAGFHSRPDALLDSDPHWQRFLDSIERKREEQEVRRASADRSITSYAKELIERNFKKSIDVDKEDLRGHGAVQRWKSLRARPIGQSSLRTSQPCNKSKILTRLTFEE